MKATVLITTYNNPAYLQLALAGYTRQTERDYEILVCDDGSGPETADMLERFRSESGLDLHHVWQEDDGYRRGHILNEGAARSRGDLLILTDQDCIPHRRFVEEHVRNSGRDTVGFGRVVRLGEELSQEIGMDQVRSGWMEAGLGRLLWWAATGKARAIEAGLYLGRIPLVRNMGTAFHQLIGNNFSCPKALFERVNGFDERFEGWGREDTEIGWRFQHAGCTFRNLKFQAVLYHLWHPELSRDRLDRNDRILEETIETGRDRCEIGYSGHLEKQQGSL